MGNANEKGQGLEFSFSSLEVAPSVGFNHFDTNGNGHLDQKEFESFLRAWLKWRSGRENTEEAKLLAKELPILVAFAKGRLDKSFVEDVHNSLSRSLAAHGKLQQAEKTDNFEARILLVSAALHLLCDTDDTGVITEENWGDVVEMLAGIEKNNA